MSIFTIQQRINEVLDNLIDENGVINEDAEAELEALQLDKKEKIENTALYIKQLGYEVKALQDEKKSIDTRIRQKRNTTEYLKGLLDTTLEGKKFETPKARVSFRKTTKVEVDPPFTTYAQERGMVDYINIDIRINPDKKEIKKALQDGEQIEYCHLVEGKSVIVK